MVSAVLYSTETWERPNQKKSVAAAKVAIPKESELYTSEYCSGDSVANASGIL
jgi:predicted adenine nucleotide alpha hydrolase (AANH) superfamily ATPase